MENKYYLLSVKELCEEKGEKRLLRMAFERVDKTRRKKAECIRSGAARAASLGAGLILQLGVQEALRGEYDDKEPERGKLVSGSRCSGREGSRGIKEKHPESSEKELEGKEEQHKDAREKLTVYTVSRVLNLLTVPLDLQFDYGVKGKPYLRDYPFYYNLSHSGEYVFCVISDREVGVDIQQLRSVDESRLAGRFFTEEERRALKACADSMERRMLFYRLWTRKEAYGKLTGEGIAAVLGRSMLPAAVPTWSDVDSSIYWQEWSLPEYAIMLCGYEMQRKYEV